MQRSKQRLALNKRGVKRIIMMGWIGGWKRDFDLMDGGMDGWSIFPTFKQDKTREHSQTLSSPPPPPFWGVSDLWSHPYSSRFVAYLLRVVLFRFPSSLPPPSSRAVSRRLLFVCSVSHSIASSTYINAAFIIIRRHCHDHDHDHHSHYCYFLIWVVTRVTHTYDP